MDHEHAGHRTGPEHTSEPVTTTHAEHGAGDPQIVIVASPHGDDLGVPKRYPLDKDEVTIGSGPDQDVQLPGADPHHLTIYHDERDEYRVKPIGPVGGGSASEPENRALRTGARIEVAGWELTFQRAEYADHGRPFGGREGGEGSLNRLQPPRPADRDDPQAEHASAGETQVEDQRPRPERQQ